MPVPEARFYIQEYQILGSKKLKRAEVEEAVYPFLGPERTAADVEGARAALEKAYKSKGFETVAVEIPSQDGAGGIVQLRVVEAPVGRLRVRGSRYFSLSEIKRQAPSMREGNVPNFNDVTRDIIALNQLSDRRVTPSLRVGAEPGTVDIDLTVEDKLPLHGSVELNNRYSANTTQTRLSGAVSYANLWQRGHQIGASFQVAPERTKDSQVFSGFYTARFPQWKWLTLTLQATRQESDVAVIGGAASIGRGTIVGLRAGIELPAGKNFYQSISLGADYKHLDQRTVFTVSGGSQVLASPVRYVPLSLSYGAVWTGKGWSTEFNASGSFNLRVLSDEESVFDTRRFNSSASFTFVRGELSHTRDLPAGFQLAARFQGQASSGPLIDSEQFSAGGLSTVRGYLESTVVGDNAALASVELRSPSLAAWIPGKWLSDLRLYAFLEGGVVNLHDPLPEQQSRFYLAAYGVGGRIKFSQYLSGSLDLGVPLIGQSAVKPHSLLLTFRVSGEF